MASVWRLFKEGGLWNWPLLLLFVLGVPLTIGLGVVAIRRPRFPVWTLGILPLSMTMIAWLGHALTTMKIRAILDSESIDPSQRARILAEGIAETLSLNFFAGFYVALLAAFVAILTGIRALRHGPRARFGGMAYGALGGGLACVVVAIVARGVMLRSFGGFGGKALVPPMVGVLGAIAGIAAATCAAAALASEEGDIPTRAEIGKDAFAALAAAVLAVLGASLEQYVSDWRNVFGAVAGASVGPVDRARIFELGGEEAGQLFSANMTLLLPIAVAGGAATLPRAADFFRGLVRAWPAAISFVVMVALLGVLPRVRVASAMSEITRASAIEWPKLIEPVVVADGQRLEGLPGRPLFVASDRVWVDGKEERTTLRTEKECAAQVLRARGVYGDMSVAIAPDASVPSSVLVCLADAIMFKSTAASSTWDGRVRGISFVVQASPLAGDRSKPSAPLTGAVAPVDVASAIDARAFSGAHVHLSKQGWKLRRSSSSADESGTGEIPDLPSGSEYAPTRILVTTDPDVPARALLSFLARAKYGTRFVLGPADAKAFEATATTTSSAPTAGPPKAPKRPR